MGMKVWIDQDLCTGDGLCEEIAPSVFTLLDDGLAYVREGTKVFSDPGGPEAIEIRRVRDRRLHRLGDDGKTPALRARETEAGITHAQGPELS